MMQTRHFFAVLLGVLSLLVVTGIGRDSANAKPVAVTQEAVFVTPRDSYAVVPYREEDPSPKRTVFIAKVRSALLHDLSLRKTEEAVAVSPMPTIAEGSLNYGDAIVPAGTSTLLVKESLLSETLPLATSSPQQ